MAAFEHGVYSPLSVPLTHDGVSTMSDPSPSSLNAGPDPDGPDPDTWYIQTTLNGPEAGVRNILILSDHSHYTFKYRFQCPSQ